MRAATPKPATLRWLRVRRRSICGVTVCGLLDWSCALLMRQGLPADHCAHAAAESGKKNHPDMDEKEEQQSQRDEEVKRARGLLAAQQIHGGRKCGNKGGGHRQASPDH